RREHQTLLTATQWHFPKSRRTEESFGVIKELTIWRLGGCLASASSHLDSFASITSYFPYLQSTRPLRSKVDPPAISLPPRGAVLRDVRGQLNWLSPSGPDDVDIPVPAKIGIESKTLPIRRPSCGPRSCTFPQKQFLEMGTVGVADPHAMRTATVGFEGYPFS